ncbi:hypothetical protein [Limimaricola soesokkakensis]|uniref:hypothetical protein n=1 Tax=Limimaricola soesokkakensis TaxID=1343159 RepID=UPI003515E6E8
MADHLDGSFDPTTVDIRLHETWGMSNPETGASVHVEWGLDRPRDEDLEGQLEAFFPDPWRHRYKWYRPVERLPPGAPPPEWRAEILGGLRRRLTAMGIAGADQFVAFPTGWVWIAQVMAHHMSVWTHDGEQIRIQPIDKELGMLRCYAHDSARLKRLCRWAQCQSEERCMATGMPGETRVEDGRVLTLSDEMYDLFERDPIALQDRMYRA